MSLLCKLGECLLQIDWFGDVGSDSGLVHSIQHVFAVHGQRVRCGEHLLLALLLQRGDGVLLGQPHFADQLRHVFVQQLLGALDLRGDERCFTQVCLRRFSSILPAGVVSVTVTLYKGKNLKVKCLILLLRLDEDNKMKEGRTSVTTDSCNVGRISSTLWIRIRSAIPTDCTRDQTVKESAAGLGRFKAVYIGRRFANLDSRGVLLRFQLGNVILELDNNFDQIHDGAVDLVIRAVQLSRRCRLKKAFQQ